jgi:predicted SnoaL-like aldol condensation-catalyzing enzyme
MVRGFEDNDYVFAQMEYDFSSRKICFEVFRFEDGQAVEHWDNIQPRLGPNQSGHSMVDGATGIEDLEFTEDNRERVRQFAEIVLIGKDIDRLADFINEQSYTEHNPRLGDDLVLLDAELRQQADGGLVIDYQTLHRVLAQGNFVLSVCEGRYRGAHTAFYDLFRLSQGKIVEHWDTTEPVAPASDWKNANGKF